MSDLTDRMRTCAAHILATIPDEVVPRVARHAADLLIEASNVIEAIPQPLGEPMAIIEPVAVSKPSDTKIASAADMVKGVWTTNAGDLPAVPTAPPAPRPNRVCPKCDSRAAKRVFRNGTELFLACPVCAAAWPYVVQRP